ncbi:hypothetical protein [Hoylesella oralis]|uniref:hypothetical protein n=1 Tax=Hoylesella oralis TaxID=28134 RepID=UPI0028EFC70F|nr:hypothetical protein [Hoylesella oralis]
MDEKMTDINKLCKLYIKQGLWAIIGLSFFILSIMWIGAIKGMLVPLTVAVVFSLMSEITEAKVWCRVAQRAVDSLPTFFMAVSGFRMLLALIVFFVYYLIAGRSEMSVFFLIFLVFYLMLIIHHALFFAKMQKS